MRYRAFGVTVESELDWPGCVPAPDAIGPVVRMREVAFATLTRPDDGDDVWEAEIDGNAVRLVSRHDGAHVLEYGPHARFVISADRDEVAVAVADPLSAGWQRFLLDSVLLILSHLRGQDLLYGAAVEIGGSAVAMLGGLRTGKTTVTAELVALGYAFVADGVIALDHSSDDVVVHPGPPVMSLPLGADLAVMGPAVPLATVGDTQWVALPHHADSPLRLGAVVLLGRQGQRKPAMKAIDPTAIDLLGYSVGFDESPERSLRRFHLIADVASTVPVFALDAPSGTSSALLATLIERAVAQDASVGPSPEP